MASNDFVSIQNIQKSNGDPFVSLKISLEIVTSGIRYIRFALNPVWVVIVEGDSLAIFTAQM